MSFNQGKNLLLSFREKSLGNLLSSYSIKVKIYFSLLEKKKLRNLLTDRCSFGVESVSQPFPQNLLIGPQITW